jgi:hypothetical protein
MGKIKISGGEKNVLGVCVWREREFSEWLFSWISLENDHNTSKSNIQDANNTPIHLLTYPIYPLTI